MRNDTEKVVLAGFFIAIGSVLAFLFHSISMDMGHIMSPMHFPVLVAGIVIGWKYGLAVGIITPLINSVMFGVPPLFPVAIGMSLELAAYGAIIGLVYQYLKVFKNHIFNIYFALIIAMIIGRIINGTFLAIVMNIMEKDYSFLIFIGAVVVTPFPSIVIQILTIPAIVNFIENKKRIHTTI